MKSSTTYRGSNMQDRVSKHINMVDISTEKVVEEFLKEHMRDQTCRVVKSLYLHHEIKDVSVIVRTSGDGKSTPGAPVCLAADPLRFVAGAAGDGPAPADAASLALATLVAGGGDPVVRFEVDSAVAKEFCDCELAGCPPELADPCCGRWPDWLDE